MKVYCIVSVSRQLNGEAVGIRFEKAYSDLAKAQAYADTLAKTVIETIGGVQFSVERGLHELDLEE